MTAKSFDVLEALRLLFDLLDRVKDPVHREYVYDLLETALRLVPDYITAYPEKRIAVMAVLNRVTGASISSLDEAMAHFFSLPPAQGSVLKPAAVDRPEKVPVDVPVVKPVADTKSAVSMAPSESAQGVAKTTQLRDWLTSFRSKKPQKDGVTLHRQDTKKIRNMMIPDREKKKQDLLKKIEALRYGGPETIS